MEKKVEKKVEKIKIEGEKVKKFISPLYNVVYQKDFLDEKESKELYDKILKEVVFSTTGEKYSDNGEKLKRRWNCTYGDEGLVYHIQFKDKNVERKCIPWKDFPILLKYKERIENSFLVNTKHKITTVTIQLYESGDIGINPHRDKEMVPGTKIFGLSLASSAQAPNCAARGLGETRKLIVECSKYIIEKNKYFQKLQESGGLKPIEIDLENGSLYIFNPPTNDKCTHCIPKEENKGLRLSLTFRTY